MFLLLILYIIRQLKKHPIYINNYFHIFISNILIKTINIKMK